MAHANIAMNIIEDNPQHQTGDNQPLIKYYKATMLIPEKPPVLHRLLDKQPAAWASVQIASGILSFGLGVVFAVAFGMEELLLTLFRVPLLTGIMFLFAGFLSNLLYKHPGLLQICFHSNILCLAVATIGVVLLCVDLAKYKDDLRSKVEVVVLCVTILDMVVSIVLIIFIRIEKLNLDRNGTSSGAHQE